MSRLRITAVLLASGLLAGCTSTIFKSFDLESGQSKSIDAKQRLVLVKKNGGRSGKELVVCAEPSPDAITALGTAFAGSGGTIQGGGSLSYSSSEAAASIGLRTQTITLLRDGYYRLCEAYMNGALSREQYNLALVNIDDVMVRLLVVDAVAGTPRPPAVAITSGVAGTSARTNLTASTSAPATGDGGDDANSSSNGTTNALDTSAQVNSLEPKIEIEEITNTGGGIDQHAASVLNTALRLTEPSNIGPLCTSFLADPDFLPTEWPAIGRDSTDYKKRLLDLCKDHLEQDMVTDLPALRRANASLRSTVDGLNGTVGMQNQLLQQKEISIKENAAKVDAQKDIVTFSKVISTKALENPKHVHSK